ncbi:MAG: hypothetical protein COV34_00430 [Candidatus Zambryskibacteria bacterium CG10_big_fil_rev_8_21_14_0_10_42_12]|uniref:Uncharacterized protein n=1 Tax=Candidatus Zambryskibacteria bacterium CG10_big_fil_rev_8_21_14_0_10_42_12 TaxID=1975115 RepID=A0A2H0QWX5_9BACT|nr:MAG: hypothetical protein COV34_00430 [Candidatus Zambryskibacteria bacterium CG10_big_fil_rev_8_21_14_0_10_42_12]
MKTNTKFIIAIALLVVAGLFFWGKQNQSVSIMFWNETGIECLSDGHVNLAQHIHPAISVTMDGEPVAIPANIGVTSTCMAEVHTHDASGEIHIETVEAGKEFGVGDFFVVWGEDFAKEGYRRSVTVNGVEVDVETYTMKDHDEIIVSYISEGIADVGVEVKI